MIQYEAEKRVEALLYYMGWQGGTIHQSAAETGISATALCGTTGTREFVGAKVNHV